MSKTANFNFDLIDFDKAAWHTDEHKNWQLADAVLKRYLSLTNVQGVWDNALTVAVDEVYVDGDLGTLFTVLVAHTTPSTGTFAAARVAKSSYWETYTDPTATETGIKMSFTTAITDTDQGAGKIWLNNATSSSATVLYVDDVEVDGVSINAWADALDNVTNGEARGVLYLAKYGSSSDLMIFNVTGAVTSASTYTKVPITHVLTVGSFSDADTIGVLFTPSGEDGTDASGTVTSIAAGTGFSFSTITESGTIAVDGVLEDLDTLGAVSSDGEIIVGTGAGAFAYESGATARTSLGAGTLDNIVEDTSPQLGGALDPNSQFIGREKGGDIASASPLVIDTDGDYFDVTGTTNYAAMTVAVNRHFFLQFDGALTMTHHSTNLDLPGEANITTAAGDVGEFFSTGANTVQCVNYTKADGTAVVIGADSITGAKIADDAIDSEHYTDGSIDNAHMADNSIDSDQYVDGSIDAVHIASNAVTTAKINADAVTSAKIADDAIDSEHYTDGSIDEAHLADNAVTLAKMAGGTDGNIISYDASGDPVAIATGNDGQVLTSTGAGSPPAFEDASGGGVGFTSSDQTVTADTLLNVSHSLGAIPTRWSVRLKCNSAESGYVSNDELDIGGVINSVGDAGVTYQADATNITIVTGQYIYVTVQSTFNHSNITVGNWRWVVRASL